MEQNELWNILEPYKKKNNKNKIKDQENNYANIFLCAVKIFFTQLWYQVFLFNMNNF